VASPAGDLDVSARLKEMIHIKWEATSSPARDFLASPNVGICDTTLIQLLHRRFIYKYKVWILQKLNSIFLYHSRNIDIIA